jgi:hypothetical protein
MITPNRKAAAVAVMRPQTDAFPQGIRYGDGDQAVKAVRVSHSTEWIDHPAHAPADRYRQVDPEDVGALLYVRTCEALNSTYEPAKLSTIGRDYG